jgi:hypothetical protein
MPDDLHDLAQQTRRRQEYKAQDEAWRKAEQFLGINDQPPAARVRFKLAFTLGWQGATNFHTVQSARPRPSRRSTP